MTGRVDPHGETDGDFTVRAYRPGDEIQLVQLYRDVFGRERRVEQWRWKMLGREDGIVPAWVAEENESGRIVAQYCGIPIQMMLGGGVRDAVHSVEAMTAPDRRRKGMFTGLMTAAHRSWALAGRCVVVGLPNQQWGTRARALDWQPLFPLTWLRFPLRLDRLVASPGGQSPGLPGIVRPGARLASTAWRGIFLGGRRQSGCELVELPCAELSTLERQIDGFWAEMKAIYPNGFVLDSSWLKWRFAPESGFDYKMIAAFQGSKLVGYLVYRWAESRGRTTGYLADIYARPGDGAIVREMVVRALQELDKAGAAAVATTAPPGSVLFGMLRKVGFVPSKNAFSFELVQLDQELEVAQLADARLWHLTAGNFDVI